MSLKEIFIATHNEGKIKELEALLAPYSISVKSSKDIPYPETDETGTTFEKNAILKAVEGFKASGIPTIADDSGICVDALDGEPGVYSARYKGGYRTVLEKIKDSSNRKAKFVCVIAFVTAGDKIELFKGESEGVITQQPRGEGGFGYDPVFIPNGDHRTYAEMTAMEKAQTSHRNKALKSFLGALDIA
jgi:XTP/dITP diphosphohydrolase